MKNFIQNSLNSQKIFYRYFRKKGFKRFLKENILETEGSSEVKAKSIALGVFIGFTPLWGFHTVVVLFLATIFKLNKFLAYMGTNVSFPLFIPFVIFISMRCGAPFSGGLTDFKNESLDLEFVKNHLLQYLIGSTILANVSSLFVGFSFYFILKNFNSHSPK